MKIGKLEKSRYVIEKSDESVGGGLGLSRDNRNELYWYIKTLQIPMQCSKVHLSPW